MKDDIRKLRLATNDFMQKQFASEMGQKALVERHKVGNSPRVEQLREVLRDIARDLQEQDAGTKGLDYLGSFSVHVYASPILGALCFQALSAPDRCIYEIADAAMRELNGSVMEMYGHKRQLRRSGAA